MALKEKIGYGLGDMSSSMFWKIFTAYLPFFYSTVFGLSLVDATLLMLVSRIWDAVSDPLMGIVADRTSTRWGRYRPYPPGGARPGFQNPGHRGQAPAVLCVCDPRQ